MSAKWIKRLPALAMIIAFLAIAGGCIHWRWSECRGVGHGVAYCLREMGR